MKPDTAANITLFASAFLIIFLIAFCAIMLIRRGRINYDERQIIARGKAYKFGFVAMTLYFVASELVCIISKVEWASHETNLSIGICFSVVTFAIVCIIKDAYVGFNQKMSSILIPLIIIGLGNIALGIITLKKNHWNIIYNDQLYLPANLVCGAAVFIVIIVALIKYSMENRE